MPQGISSALSSIASSPITKDALNIAQIGSTGYNLYNQYQQQQYQNKLRELSTDPAAMGKLAAGYTKPLNAGLTTGVANQAQSYLASRGLSDSPQISQQVEAQAIAPYIQQNQQQGYQDALNALQLGGGAIPPGAQQQQGLASLADIFSQLGGSGNLASIIKLANAGSGTIQPTTPAFGTGDNIPYVPIQNLDLGAFYTPDYASAGGDGGVGWGG